MLLGGGIPGRRTPRLLVFCIVASLQRDNDRCLVFFPFKYKMQIKVLLIIEILMFAWLVGGGINNLSLKMSESVLFWFIYQYLIKLVFCKFRK